MTEGLDSVITTFGASAVADPPRAMFMATFSSQVTTRETDHGTHVISGLRIFKAGTFADSMGIVRTWTSEHLDQMALHFELLRNGGYFPNVPVREDHSFSVRDVCGYFMSVYRDQSDASFLASDIEITEPDAFEKWQRGTYRSRSIEIGTYETNGEEPQMYFPVIMGLAFVDIPAVEGLHRKNPADFPLAMVHNKENTMTDEEKAAWIRAAQYAQALVDWEAAARYAQACADWEAAVNYAQAVEDHAAEATALGLTADHARGAAPTVFTINGAPTADGSTVQAHITSLETFRQESINSARHAFIDSLAQFGKIGQPQVESMKALVLTMDDSQYTAFKESYDAQGVAPLFGSYGTSAGGGGNPNGQAGGPVQTVDEEIATLEEIVANHKRAGKTQEQIEALDSFKKLTTLKAQKA